MGSAGWTMYTQGTLTKALISEHVDQIWGFHDPPKQIWYKPDVTSTNPQGLKILSFLQRFDAKLPISVKTNSETE